MQREHFLEVNVLVEPENEEEEARSAYDFSECTRIKKLTTHE